MFTKDKKAQIDFELEPFDFGPKTQTKPARKPAAPAAVIETQFLTRIGLALANMIAMIVLAVVPPVIWWTWREEHDRNWQLVGLLGASGYALVIAVFVQVKRYHLRRP